MANVLNLVIKTDPTDNDFHLNQLIAYTKTILKPYNMILLMWIKWNRKKKLCY